MEKEVLIRRDWVMQQLKPDFLRKAEFESLLIRH